MRIRAWDRRVLGAATVIVLLAIAAADTVSAQSGFPTIPVWAFAGRLQGSPALDQQEATQQSRPPEGILRQPRVVTLRWLRDPRAEAREDFGGYRIYRVTNEPDTSRMVLVRRFSLQSNESKFLWHFPAIDTLTPLSGRIATFVDPDSNGNFHKRCRLLDVFGRCVSRGDSIIVLLAPAGPHDGFRTWYSITYERKNSVNGGDDFEDLFVPDTLHCATPSDPNRCPNLNSKSHNMTAAVEPTPGPTSNLETVAVVPNPYRASEAWDLSTAPEVHFINLPPKAKISIYTSAGDLVTEFEHNDTVRDFARWDLRNGTGQDVSSGIYLYRVTSGSLAFQGRFVVVR